MCLYFETNQSLENHRTHSNRGLVVWICENSHPANEEWSLQLLVKTAHKQYPKEILAETELERGDWTSVTSTIDDVKLLAVRFQDLKYKQFISTCSTSKEGPPGVTKHHGNNSRPQVAADYLKYAAGIDMFGREQQHLRMFGKQKIITFANFREF